MSEATDSSATDPPIGSVFACDGRVREVVSVVNRVIGYRYQFGWKTYLVHWWTWQKWQGKATRIR